VHGIGIDLPSRLDAEQDGREAQEALALRGLGMATANPGSDRALTARVVSLTSHKRSTVESRRHASTWRCSMSAVVSAESTAISGPDVGCATAPL